MITVNLLCRQIKNGSAYSIFLRYYDSSIKKIMGSETLNLEVSKNYFGKGENMVMRILAKDKEKMQLAESILTQRKSEILGNRFDIDTLKTPTPKLVLMEEIKKVVEEKGHDTYRAMQKYLENYLREGGSITEEIEGFQDYLLKQNKKNGEKSLSQTSVHHYMNRLQIIMNLLEERRIIPKKIKGIDIIKEKRKETVYLSVEEIQRIMNVVVTGKCIIIKYAYLFGCFTGLRRSDVLNLKWEDVCGEILKIETIKTKSYEEIALPETALYILSLLENKGKKDENVFRFGLSSLAKALDEIASKAGIDKKIRFHSSRHTFGTVLFEAGVDIYTVQRLLTHKNIASTMVYAHINNEDRKKAVNKLPNLKMKN